MRSSYGVGDVYLLVEFLVENDTTVTGNNEQQDSYYSSDGESSFSSHSGDDDSDTQQVDEGAVDIGNDSDAENELCLVGNMMSSASQNNGPARKKRKKSTNMAATSAALREEKVVKYIHYNCVYCTLTKSTTALLCYLDTSYSQAAWHSCVWHRRGGTL